MVTEAEAQTKFDELGSVVKYMEWLRSNTFPRILEMDEFKALVRRELEARGKPVPAVYQEALE